MQTSLLDGLDGPVRPRRLEPALRARPTSSPALAAGGARLGAARWRSSAAARPRSSPRPPAACSRRAARSCSSATPSAPGEVAGAARRSSATRRLRSRATSPGGSGWSRRDGGRRRSERAIAAIRAGEAVLLPTDGVYGLCASPLRRGGRRGALYALKGRGEDAARRAPRRERRGAARAACPSSRGRAERDRARAPARARTRSCSPNPARRYPLARPARGPRRSASGSRAARRRPSACSTRSARSRRRARTSRAAPPPARLDDVPAAIRAGCGAELDAGAPARARPRP